MTSIPHLPKRHTLHAVLTGDIVNFTLLGSGLEKQLLKLLERIFQPYPFEFYRGDSFQVYMEAPRTALKLALLCRAVAIGLTQDREKAPCDIRISIGIGEVEGSVKKPGLAKGEAFLLSGRSFDYIEKGENRLIIVTGNELANVGLMILADYINSIYNAMTPKQATIIAGLLAGKTQQRLADEQQKSKSTIYQLAISGRWAEIEKQLSQFEEFIDYLS